jgi:hypothetical protein
MALACFSPQVVKVASRKKFTPSTKGELKMLEYKWQKRRLDNYTSPLTLYEIEINRE